MRGTGLSLATAGKLSTFTIEPRDRFGNPQVSFKNNYFAEM